MPVVSIGSLNMFGRLRLCNCPSLCCSPKSQTVLLWGSWICWALIHRGLEICHWPSRNHQSVGKKCAFPNRLQVVAGGLLAGDCVNQWNVLVAVVKRNFKFEENVLFPVCFTKTCMHLPWKLWATTANLLVTKTTVKRDLVQNHHFNRFHQVTANCT